MSTYGDKKEPGIVTSLDSVPGVTTAGAAPSDLGIVGQADLASTGSDGADPNTVYEVTRPQEARTLFGSETDSLLTAAILDAFEEGAFPVFAVATEEIDVSGEDLSGLSSNTGTLANAPVSEDPDDITFTINGTTMTTVVTYDDVSNVTPDTDEVYVDAVDGEFVIDSGATVGNSGDDVDYTHYDYTSAHDAMKNDAGEDIDFFCSINENQDVADDAQTTTSEMEDEYNLALTLIGPGDTTIDPSSYSQSYDDSRTQVVFGTRYEDGTSLLAAYAGKRASLGLDRTPISVTLNNGNRIHDVQADDLTRNDRSNLIDSNVVPIADEPNGVRIIDDPTTVTSSNSQESNIDFGFTRLLIDYIVNVVRLNEQPFIGRLNNPAVRNTFKSLIEDEANSLRESGVVLNYTITVSEVDATTAKLSLNVEAAKPIRFIENDVTVGSA